MRAIESQANPDDGTGGHLLTVLHAAEPTGPPLLALRFLRWLRTNHPSWKTSTLVWDSGGGLDDDFAQLGEVVFAGPRPPHSSGHRPHHRLLVRAQLRRIRRRLNALGPIDIAHVHCAGMMRAYPALPAVPVLCHLHELQVGLDLHLGPLAREHILAADHYVTVSDAVRDLFLARFRVDPGQVERQWGFVEAAQPRHQVDRVALGLPIDAFIVASAGLRHWRKAPELFVRTAIAAKQQAPEIRWRFLWVGGIEDGGLGDLVQAAGLNSLVTFVPHEPDPQRWLAAGQAFFLPAREDAFPLVCVEAAALGLPIVTFDNGGAPELVGHAGCGTVVPFPDVEAAAGALVELARNPEKQVSQGARARRFVQRRLLLEHAGPALLASIQATRRAAP